MRKRSVGLHGASVHQFGTHVFARLALGNGRLWVAVGVQLVEALTGLAVGDQVVVLTSAGQFDATIVGTTSFGSADAIDRKAKASTAPFMMAVYRQEGDGTTYEIVRNVYVPLVINGQRWGDFELAYVL